MEEEVGEMGEYMMPEEEESPELLFFDVFGNRIAPVLSEFRVFNFEEHELSDRKQQPPKDDKEN
jgi:hypothetical protein